MAKRINIPIFLHFQQLPKERLQKGSHIFESTKQSIKLLVTKHQKSDNHISNKALIGATQGFLDFVQLIRTDDCAPEHKKRTGLKFYSNKLKNLHNKDIFKKNGIVLFEKVQDSCYIQSELAKKTRGYTGGYTHTYQLSPAGLELYQYLQDFLRQLKNTPKTKDLLNLRSIKSKDLEGLNTFKIQYSKFKELYGLYHKIFILRKYQDNESFVNSMRSIPFLLKNVLGYKSGYVYVDNRDLGKSKQDREYTVYTCISKSLRKYIHADYMEIDLDCSCLSMNLNIYNEIAKQTGGKYIEIRRKRANKIIPRQYNARDSKIEFPTITSYLNNKYGGRSSVQNALGFKDIDESKQFITSLNYDSNRGNLEFNPNARRVNVIYAKQMMKEIQKLQSTIHEATFKTNLNFGIMGTPVQEIRDSIEKSIQEHKLTHPKKYGRGKKLLGKRMARLYFMLEKKTRDLIIKYLDRKNVTDYYQIHDCLTFGKRFKKEIKIQEIQDLIKLKYGYKLTLSSSEDETNFLKRD